MPKRPMQALDGADALLIVTEWKSSAVRLRHRDQDQAEDPIIFDGRNLFDPSCPAKPV